MTDCTCTNFPASLGSITFEGSVGIGTTSPLAPLDVATSTFPQLVVRGGSPAGLRIFPGAGGTTSSVEAFTTTDPSLASGYSRLRLTVDGATAWLIADASGGPVALPLAVQVGGAERLRITTAGNVGIGTTTPVAAFDAMGGAELQSGQNLGPITLAGVSGELYSFAVAQRGTDATNQGQAGFGLVSGANLVAPIIWTFAGNPIQFLSKAYTQTVQQGTLLLQVDEAGVHTNASFTASGRKVADGGGCYYA